MGISRITHHPMAWQSTLGAMKTHGVTLAQTADCKCRSRWVVLDLDEMLAEHGPEWVVWGQTPPCRRCGKPGWFMASPGPSTPFRPLKGS